MFLWKQDSRRDPGVGQGASVTWACAYPGLCCWWGLLALVRGDGERVSLDGLLSAVPWGALWTQCLGARQKVSGHQSAASGASQTYRQPPSTHTPTTLCTDLHRRCRRPSIWQSSIHTDTEQSTSGNLLPHCQPVLRCDRVRTTGHNVPTNILLPRGRTSPQVPLPCTWRWGQLALPRKGSSVGKAWCGQLYFDWDYLRCPPGKGSEAPLLSTEPTETSEKPLPPGFPEAEALVSQHTTGEYPSGWRLSSQVNPNLPCHCC